MHASAFDTAWSRLHVDLCRTSGSFCSCCVVAESDAEARRRAATFGHWVHSIRTGHGAIPYPDPATAAPLSAEQAAVVQDRLDTQFVGSPDTVVERLGALQRLTGADELVVTSVTHSHEDRLESHRLLARAWGLSGLRAA